MAKPLQVSNGGIETRVSECARSAERKRLYGVKGVHWGPVRK